MVGTGYTGHGSSGGIQGHSKGPMYPYTVIAKGNPHEAPVRFCAYDLRTGNEGEQRGTYKEAEIDVYSLKLRNMMHT